jgi:hypothetical protein
VSEQEDTKQLITYWRQQARILIAASKDDGTSQEQRDLSIGVAKGLRFAAKQLAKHIKIGVDHA